MAGNLEKMNKLTNLYYQILHNYEEISQVVWSWHWLYSWFGHNYEATNHHSYFSHPLKKTSDKRQFKTRDYFNLYFKRDNPTWWEKHGGGPLGCWSQCIHIQAAESEQGSSSHSKASRPFPSEPLFPVRLYPIKAVGPSQTAPPAWN